MEIYLGQHHEAVEAVWEQAIADNVPERIWDEDHTVWRPDPTEISNRLDWLNMPNTWLGNTHTLDELVNGIREDGYTHVLLMGMGGSSLAPEVFQNVYGKLAGPENSYLELSILDSTDPDMILEKANQLDFAKTLFIVATKSGGTVETLSAFKYFYNLAVEKLGEDEAGNHFVAITDPESKLVTLAQEHNFRSVVPNYPNIGGRYSVLSLFGLLPAALVGVDLERLIQRAEAQAQDASDSFNLGIILGALAKEGVDKLTIVTSPELENFGDWAEQLIAESTGKDGKGILPVVGEELGEPYLYGYDRLFVQLKLSDDDSHDGALEKLALAGHPVVSFDLEDIYDLGGHFFLWEMATAVAGHVLDIHPFDQPDVESAKVLARAMVDEYKDKGQLPAGETTSLSLEALYDFLEPAKDGDYIAIQAYVQPMPETDTQLGYLRLKLQERYKIATTVGYGPRFLHSTGQLHKGDGGNGWFIQFVSEAQQDVPIPNETGSDASSMSFGVLKNAQALGDAQALVDAGRRLIRFDLGKDVVGGLSQLVVI